MAELDIDEIERVARALCMAENDDPCGSVYASIDENERNKYRVMAKAAIFTLMSRSNKIEPFRPHFENMQALLARIAEDPEATGFVGCILFRDGKLEPVNFNITRDQMAFAGAVWLQRCLDQ